MLKLLKYNKITTLILGALFIMAAIPYTCFSADKSQAQHESRGFESPSHDNQEVNGNDCCSSDVHHQIQRPNDIVSNSSHSLGLPSIVTPTILNRIDFPNPSPPLFERRLLNSTYVPIPLRC